MKDGGAQHFDVIIFSFPSNIAPYIFIIYTGCFIIYVHMVYFFWIALNIDLSVAERELVNRYVMNIDSSIFRATLNTSYVDIPVNDKADSHIRRQLNLPLTASRDPNHESPD